MLNEFGPAVVFVQTLPKAVKGVAVKMRGGAKVKLRNEPFTVPFKPVIVPVLLFVFVMGVDAVVVAKVVSFMLNSLFVPVLLEKPIAAISSTLRLLFHQPS